MPASTHRSCRKTKSPGPRDAATLQARPRRGHWPDKRSHLFLETFEAAECTTLGAAAGTRGAGRAGEHNFSQKRYGKRNSSVHCWGRGSARASPATMGAVTSRLVCLRPMSASDTSRLDLELLLYRTGLIFKRAQNPAPGRREAPPLRPLPLRTPETLLHPDFCHQRSFLSLCPPLG